MDLEDMSTSMLHALTPIIEAVVNMLEPVYNALKNMSPEYAIVLKSEYEKMLRHAIDEIDHPCLHNPCDIVRNEIRYGMMML